jgi:hypothetical protein
MNSFGLSRSYGIQYTDRVPAVPRDGVSFGCRVRCAACADFAYKRYGVVGVNHLGVMSCYGHATTVFVLLMYLP